MAVNLSRNFRGGRTASANRPNRLVSQQDTREVLSGQRSESALELPLQHRMRQVSLALAQSLAHTDDRSETRFQSRLDFAVHRIVRFAEKLPALGMPDNHSAASALDQHARRNF